MAERERILSSKRYKLDHEPFDWEREYLELMDGAWDEAREAADGCEACRIGDITHEKEQLHEID